MSKRSLAVIDQPSLVAFHKTWYAPNHALLAVAGDVDVKALKAQLTKSVRRLEEASGAQGSRS